MLRVKVLQVNGDSILITDGQEQIAVILILYRIYILEVTTTNSG